MINRYREGVSRIISLQINGLGSKSVATIAGHELICQFDLEGKPSSSLPPESVALRAADEIFVRFVGELLTDQSRLSSQSSVV